VTLVESDLVIHIYKRADQIIRFRQITPIFLHVLGRFVCFLNASAVSDVRRISAMFSASLFLVPLSEEISGIPDSSWFLNCETLRRTAVDRNTGEIKFKVRQRGRRGNIVRCSLALIRALIDLR